MNRMRGIALVLAIGLPGTGCGDGGEGEMEDRATPAGQQPAGEARAQGSAATLLVDTLDGAGPYLSDGNRIALYLIEGEPADSSICYDECAEEWPPFLATGATPRAGAAAVRADLIGTIERRDGSRQVTYGGQPLYYYHDDEEPGDTHGQDVHDDWGAWYLVRPQGGALHEN